MAFQMMKKRFNIPLSDFLYFLFSSDTDLYSIYREQYELAKKGISLQESNKMPEFVRKAFISFVIEDKKLDNEFFLNSLRT